MSIEEAVIEIEKLADSAVIGEQRAYFETSYYGQDVRVVYVTYMFQAPAEKEALSGVTNALMERLKFARKTGMRIKLYWRMEDKIEIETWRTDGSVVVRTRVGVLPRTRREDHEHSDI